jgi:polyisoprenoid-binding protein YceI
VRSPEFLDVERHPTMTFRSTGISGAGDDWTMDGDLTVAGVTRPVSFPVEFCGSSDAMGRLSAGFTTSGTVSRREHGIDFGPMYNVALGDAVRFDLDFEFHAPA